MPRHEQQTVRMALAAALHHSAGPKEKVEIQQNGAPRRQGREVEEQAAHAGLQAQKTPPRARPGILAEPGPQTSDRSRRHFQGDTHPTLGLPVLAGESGEVVDASTLAFLTRAVLEEKRKAEVEAAKEKVKEEWRRRQRRQALTQEFPGATPRPQPLLLPPSRGGGREEEEEDETGESNGVSYDPLLLISSVRFLGVAWLVLDCWISSTLFLCSTLSMVQRWIHAQASVYVTVEGFPKASGI